MIKKIIKKVIESTGYRLSKIKKWDIQYEQQISKDNFFDLYFGNINPDTFFYVQIGANNGKTNDPIYPYVTTYKLHGLSIEAQPRVFKELVETYKAYPNVTCVNAAIAKTSSALIPFYTVKESVITDRNYTRMTGIATFNKDVIRHTIKNKIPQGVNVDDYIEETLVKTTTLPELLDEYGVANIDMIQIDCEGFDYEIIKMIDFNKFSPSIINFESNHISDKDREDCQKMLESNGYKWFRHGIDTCAYKI